MHASKAPKGFREDPNTGELACPHRDVTCCPACAAAHPEIVEVASQHFWTHSPDEKAELVALKGPARNEPPVGSWAATARMMADLGIMSGDEADAWKDEMKDRDLE